jgi:hypothetical protein
MKLTGQKSADIHRGYTHLKMETLKVALVKLRSLNQTAQNRCQGVVAFGVIDEFVEISLRKTVPFSRFSLRVFSSNPTGSLIFAER